MTEKRKSRGYYGFPSKEAYERYYSDPDLYAWEIPLMEAYTREAEEEAASLNLAKSDQQEG